LAVIPTYLRSQADVDMLGECFTSLRRTSDCDVFIVDDGGPLEGAVEYAHEHGAEVVRTKNHGFSHAVNRGLVRAYEEGRDAVLVNSDVVFRKQGWLNAMTAVDAAVVGALLIYPSRVVQHAGIYYCPLQRAWAERFKYAPRDLPAVHEPYTCPVTGALQLVRHEAMDRIEFYDEDFRLGWEDVDYCVRAFKAGLRCAYEPKAVAYHHESFTRGRQTPQLAEWTNESWMHFQEKWKDEDFRRFHHG
jgi:GT2 family glycosyltransferase